MGLSILRRFITKKSLRFKLLIISLSFVSCAAGLLALLSPKLLPIAVILIVPGARQVLPVSSHPLVRFLSEPQVAAVTPDGSTVYVTNLRRDSVTVIDVATDTVVGEVPVGSEPFTMVIKAGDGGPPKVYVANFGTFDNPGNTVSVIDTGTNTVLKTIEVGLIPGAMDITPDGVKLYVVNIVSGTVSVINTSVDEVIETIPVGFIPTAIAVTPDGEKAYVPNLQSDTISVISTMEDGVINTIAMDTGFGPAGVAITPDGSKVYVANSFNDTVSVISTESDSVVKSIPVGFFPVIVAVTPDGSRALVSNISSDTISVINTSTDEVVESIAVGSIPVAIAVTGDSKKAYVGNCNCGIATVDTPDTVSVLDIPMAVETKRIEVGLGPLVLALTPDNSKLYVPNSNSATVTVIDTASDEVSATVVVGNGPAEVAIVPGGAKVYVSNFRNPDVPGDTVFVIDGMTNLLTGEVGVGSGPSGLAVTPDGSKLYVANYGSISEPGSTVSVVDVATDTETGRIELFDVDTDDTLFGPMDVAISPDGTTAYVSVFGDAISGLDFRVAVIDTGSDTVVATIFIPDVIGIPSVFGPAALAVSPDGTRLYVSNLGGGFFGAGLSVSVVNTGTNTVIDTVVLPDDSFGPLDIVVTEDGSRAYVGIFGELLDFNFSFPGNSFVVIDLTSNAFLERILLPDTSGDGIPFGPSGLALTPDNTTLFVAAMDRGTIDFFGFPFAAGGLSEPGDTVFVFDVDVGTDTFTFAGEIPVGNRPFGIAVTEDGATAYVANYLSGTVSVIDVATNQVVDTVDLGPGQTIFTVAGN